MKGLKPCPFCGNRVNIISKYCPMSGHYWVVKCGYCHLTMQSEHDNSNDDDEETLEHAEKRLAKLADKWNTRWTTCTVSGGEKTDDEL